jgi:antitoxin component YwqK of YwqJK toxin-antitoxin module
VLYITADSTAVKYFDTDSTHHTTAYWIDGTTGKRLFKLEEEFFMKNRWDSVRSRWNRQGQLTHRSTWDNGVCIGTSTDWYDNGQIATEIQYDKKGNKTFEMNFHPNGNRRTDTLMYVDGKLQGNINHYDSTGTKVTETYSYVNDVLVGIRIYRDKYANLKTKVNYLEMAVKASNDTTTEQYRRRKALLARFASPENKDDVW